MELLDGKEVLDGSIYIFPSKTRISPGSEKRVAEELKDAMSKDLFQPLWPYIEEKQPSKRRNTRDRGATRTSSEEELEGSVEFSAKLTKEEKKRKAEIMRGWKAKKERPSSRPTTGFGSLDDEDINRRLENLSMLRPTLRPNLRFQPRTEDFAEGPKVSKQTFGKESDEYGLVNEGRRHRASEIISRQRLAKETPKPKPNQVKQEYQHRMPRKHSNQTDKPWEENIPGTSNESEGYDETRQRLQRLRMPRYRYEEEDQDDELPFAPRK